MKHIEEIAAKNQQKAWGIIKDTDIIPIWKSVNAEIYLVGSLKMGLLVTHRDIDFHIYSAFLNIQDDFAAIAKLAENPHIKRIEYGNLLDTDEKCIEWHAWYEHDSKELWQMDMIHIIKGSVYDGYFEKVAERVSAILTDETRQAILRLKYETPETEKIMGIEYYQAVIRDGVRTYSELTQWRIEHPVCGVIKWMP
jgi:hypothetical protein